MITPFTLRRRTIPGRRLRSFLRRMLRQLILTIHRFSCTNSIYIHTTFLAQKRAQALTILDPLFRVALKWLAKNVLEITTPANDSGNIKLPLIAVLLENGPFMSRE
jgi:hypothetical protein